MSKLIQNAIVIGASGLVGRELIQQLYKLESCQQIRIFVRSELPEFQHYEKVEQVVLSDLYQITPSDVIGFSHAFSTLGTTLKKAGSKDNFYAVDYGVNFHFAQLLQGTNTMLTLVSAMGASVSSWFFYNRVKGELENDIKMLNLDRLAIVRPSLLLGKRKEQRRAEDISQLIFGKISHFLPQKFLYKPVTAEQVAHTMVELAQFQTEKIEIYDNLSIQKTR